MLTAVKIIVIIGVLALFVLYNGKIVALFTKNSDKAELLVSKTLGKQLREFDRRLEKESAISNKGLYRWLNNYFDDILIQLDLKREGVTVTTFVFFLAFISFGLSLVVYFVGGSFVMAVFSFFAIYYLVMTVFRFIALMRYEKKEAILMETMDLIAMDTEEGVKNAITRYCGNFHPTVRPYFEQFLDDIRYQGYSFKEAMHKLNRNLGSDFSEFARACIQFEYKADDTLIDVFSPIVDSNREKRSQREISNKKFTELRVMFVVSTLVVFGYAGVLLLTEQGARDIIIGTTIGKIATILDFLVITLVLAYITKIKAKFLR